MSFTKFKVSGKKKSEIFQQENLHVPSFYATTTNTTVLLQFLPLSSECRKWYLFSFFLIISKFCFKKSFHFMAHWASWHVPPSIPKNRPQKHPELTSLQYFETDILKNFQKWKFSFFSILLKFFFRFMPRFLRLSHKLLRRFEISW